MAAAWEIEEAAGREKNTTSSSSMSFDLTLSECIRINADLFKAVENADSGALKNVLETLKLSDVGDDKLKNLAESKLGVTVSKLCKYKQNCDVQVAALEVKKLWVARAVATKKNFQLMSLVTTAFNKLCDENNMDPRSPWAQEAAELLYKKIKVLGIRHTTEDITEEILRLKYCIKTNSSVNTTWEIINKKRAWKRDRACGEELEIDEVSAFIAAAAEAAAAEAAEKAACELINEDEAEKKRAEEAKNKPSKRAAKKKAAKERQAAKALAKLAPVEEDGEDKEGGEDVEYNEDTFDAVDTTSAVQPTPPMVDTGREAHEVFNLSDIGSALCCNDDSSTSVATALQCVICFKNERAVACVPCGHRALCEECGKKEVLQDMKCPMCRADVMLFMRVWD